MTSEVGVPVVTTGRHPQSVHGVQPSPTPGSASNEPLGQVSAVEDEPPVDVGLNESDVASTFSVVDSLVELGGVGSPLTSDELPNSVSTALELEAADDDWPSRRSVVGFAVTLDWLPLEGASWSSAAEVSGVVVERVSLSLVTSTFSPVPTGGAPVVVEGRGVDAPASTPASTWLALGVEVHVAVSAQL